MHCTLSILNVKIILKNNIVTINDRLHNVSNMLENNFKCLMLSNTN